MNRNVLLTLAITIASELSSSIVGGPIYDVFLYEVTQSTMMMGLISGAFGLSQFLLFFVLAKYGDTVQYHSALSHTFWLGLLVLVASVLSFVPWIQPILVSFLFLASTLGGLYYGLRNPWMQTLFTREIKAFSQESLWFSRKRISGQIGSLVGTGLTIIVFLVCGQEWDMTVMRIVLLCGLVPFVVSLGLTRKFQHLDDFQHDLSNDMSLNTALIEKSANDMAKSRRTRWTLVATELLFMSGAGAVVAFLPVFLKETYNMSPSALLLVSLFTLLTNAILTKLCDYLSSKIGAKWSIVFFSLSGTACMFTLATTQYWNMGESSDSLGIQILVGLVCVLRSSLLNSTAGVQDSLLMDHVDDQDKTAFNGVECLNTATWVGSAVIGGLLIEWHGYYLCFFSTGVIYLLACIGLLSLPV